MPQFNKILKVFSIGLVIVVPLIYILEHIEFIILPKDHPIETTIFGGVWWGIISVMVYHISFLKKHKIILLKLLALLISFIVLLIIDERINYPDNPLSLVILLFIWLGIAHLLLPKFVQKYGKTIVAYYISLLLLFSYFRFFQHETELYSKLKHELFIPLLIIPIPILIGLWLYEQYKWIKSLQNEKSKAELALLKAQVNPHFFFNTLNNLYSLTVQNSHQAPEVILKLSDMMRYTIYEGKKELVSLKEEVAYLQNYIDLHKIRHHKNVVVNFAHTIESDVKVAPLLFIILLENAFKHGVEALTEDAYIQIDLQGKDKEVLFSIDNNFDDTDNNTSKGIGLENLQHRLDLLYPNKHLLTIHKTNATFKAVLQLN
ncbi:sensor histidine kinase [Tenacibaculum sp. 190524A02b]|uniref:sensor histidine kinase n=1 Tax=Tenacibaculum vairaonense TaxID=3137860 RepID=UPI0031FA6CDE